MKTHQEVIGDISREELIKLRKLEIFYVNLCLAIIVPLLGINYLNVGLFWLVISLLNSINVIISTRYKLYAGFIILLPSMLKLRSFEKERLGDESTKSYRVSTIAHSILIPIFLMFAFFNWGETIRVNPFFAMSLIALIFIIVNIMLYINRRKIDRSTTEDLKGFTERKLAVGLIGGFVLAGLVIIIITIFIVYRLV